MRHGPSEFLVIAQISDLHLRADGLPYNRTADTGATLAACLRHLDTLEPGIDLIVVTGDLADTPDPRAYTALRRALDDIGLPYLVIPGNHDDRAMVHDAFVDLGHYPPSGGFIQFAYDELPLRFLALDTLDPATDGARLCGERLRWLVDNLAAQPDRPTVILMHHQPILTRVPFGAKHAFEGAAGMEAIVAAYPNVAGVLCGHLHRPIHALWGGTVLSVAPSMALQRTLTLDNGLPKGFNTEPVAVPVYLWSAQAGLVCHMSFIGDFSPFVPLEPSPPIQD